MKNLHNVLSNFRTVIIFLLLVALITVIFGTVYAAVKQSYRNNANDPQVEVVDQVAALIEQDIPLDAILGGSDQVDLAESLSLFVMIFDANKNMVGSSAQIDGQVPTPPANAFDMAKQNGEYRFTWQVKDGVRVAAVFKAVDDQGYVLAGRSLQEIENREKQLTHIILISWIISVLFTLLLTLALKPRHSLMLIEETNVTIRE